MAIITTAPGQTFDFRLLSPNQFNATYAPDTTFGLYSFQSGNQVHFGFQTFIDSYIGPPPYAGSGVYNPGLEPLLQKVSYNGTLTATPLDQAGNTFADITFTGNWVMSDGSGATVATIIGAEVTGRMYTSANYNQFGQLVNYHSFYPFSVWDLIDDNFDTVTLGDGNDVYLDIGSLWIDLGGGDDWLFAAADSVDPALPPDTIFGGTGNDLIEYQNAGHYIDAGTGNDTIRSQGNGETPFTGGTFIGGIGNDSVDSTENSTVVEGAASGDDTYVLGTNSTLDYGDAGALIVDLSDPAGMFTLERTTGHRDELIYSTDFNIIGSAFDDVFRSFTATNYSYHHTLDGAGGDDKFELVFGGQEIDGGTGNDLASFQLRSDQVTISTVSGVTTVTYVDYWSNVITTTLQNVELLRFQDRDISLTPRSTVTLTSGADVWTALSNGNTTINALAGNDTITAGNGNDEIIGGTGNDSLLGGDGHDTFRYTVANSGVDAVYGGTGHDRILAAPVAGSLLQFSVIEGVEVIESYAVGGTRLLGSALADTFDFSQTQLLNISQIDMGKGNDRVTGNDDAQIIIGGAGNDTMFGGGGNDLFQIGKSAGVDQIDGGADQGGDVVEVTAAGVKLQVKGITNVEFIHGQSDTQLIGSSAGDLMDFSGIGLFNIALIDGGAGNDTIVGSAGADRISGNAGADVLTGGLGADTFVLVSSTHSRGTTADRILDLTQGEDRIDLSLIDANTLLGGLQDFNFIGAAQFSGQAGQLRYDSTSFAGETRVYADMNGDSKADITLLLTGSLALMQSDFLL
jgi:Ca2+-binding RTX toxin-like protein